VSLTKPGNNEGIKYTITVSGGDNGDLTLYCDGAESLNNQADQGNFDITVCQ
jgi:hypothetical protein